MSKGAALKAALKGKDLISAPGIYDMISAKVADRMGFPCLYMTGYGTVASALGVPDAGLATYTEMLGRVQAMAGGTKTPMVADADTGYGGLLNVERTVRGYEAAGAAGIQIEDQVLPEKCGHTPGRRVVPLEDMVRKIKVAVATRASSDFLIVARTDARTTHGLDEALATRRGLRQGRRRHPVHREPRERGRDGQDRKTFDQPLLANMVEGGKTPVLPAKQLHEMGYKMAIFPGLGFLTVAKALEQNYRVLKEEGSTARIAGDLYPFDEMNKLMGFPDVSGIRETLAGDLIATTVPLTQARHRAIGNSSP